MADYQNQEPTDETTSPKLAVLMESVNIAEKLDEEELHRIGQDAKRGFENDLRSREGWEKCLDDWTKLAKQTIERKSYPWPNASNIKYPLLSTAAMQFAARAYPSLIPSDGRVVKARIIGKDFDGTKTKTAEAVSIYMSYQLMEEMDCWEEDMDKLLIMLPIVGTIFKKTYWDTVTKKNCSHLVLPKNLVVDYWTKALYTSERISEILEINPRKVKERQRAGLWLDDVDLDLPTVEDLQNNPDAPSDIDSTTPYQFIEQHTFLDLDKDDYKEPYIVTFHRVSGKVVRIAANFDEDTMEFNEDGDLIKICPVQYYTKFGFIPNPDGSFYDIGFGVLLGPLNESVNTLINQLVDNGSLHNLQSGFLGKGLRLRMGETRFQPGEWKVVNSTGDDLKKQIVPLPAGEPSKVLLDLLQLLITSGKELASVAEIFTGKMPGQNTPATTTMATVEQGMKVFTAVYKRLYRSLAEEFHKLYRLNGLYLNPNEYQELVGMDIGPDDFNGEGHRIIPGADPTAVSQTEKLMKAQGLMEMLSAGMPLDPVKVMYRLLEAQEQPNWQELIPPQILQSGQMPPPPPDPKMLAVQAKTQADMAKTQVQVQAIAQKAEIDRSSKEAQLAMAQQEHEQEMQHKIQIAQLEAVSSIQKQRIMNSQAQAQAVQSLQHAEQAHQQQMQQGAEQSAAKVQQTKAQAKAKPSTQTKGATKK